MRIRTSLPMIFLVMSAVGLSRDVSGRNRSSFASAVVTVPTMANSPGQFGAFFKTRVSILNVTSFSYQIYATLYNTYGKVQTRFVDVGPAESKSWDNFLEAFDYRGAGAVKFDSWFDPPGGSSDFQFLVTAEVYTDSPNGRYKTVVIDAGSLDGISPSFQAFTPGIFVDGLSRTNIGCFNESISLPQSVLADLYAPAGNLLRTYSINLAIDGWNQIGVTDAVAGGYIKWRPQSSCHCWAVVVDNISNDGSFVPARDYVP